MSLGVTRPAVLYESKGCVVSVAMRGVLAERQPMGWRTTQHGQFVGWSWRAWRQPGAHLEQGRRRAPRPWRTSPLGEDWSGKTVLTQGSEGSQLLVRTEMKRAIHRVPRFGSFFGFALLVQTTARRPVTSAIVNTRMTSGGQP